MVDLLEPQPYKRKPPLHFNSLHFLYFTFLVQGLAIVHENEKNKHLRVGRESYSMVFAMQHSII